MSAPILEVGELHHLDGFDFPKLNQEVREVWKSFESGTPIRTPIILGTNTRFFLQQPQANPLGWDFRGYSEDPDLMFEALLRFQYWNRHNLLQDMELGMPQEWEITVDFQNYYEASWLGCPIEYCEGQVPDTRPIFQDNPESILDRGIPDPFGGTFARGLEYYERFLERSRKETYRGIPIRITPPFLGSDGVLTVACNLCGPEFICTQLALDPNRVHPLFDLLAQATIARIQAWRKRCGLPPRVDDFFYADDSLALISTQMYRDHVLPYHRRVLDALTTEAPRSIHLCGDATRHFRTLMEELDIRTFDTGFPVDFGSLRETLGPGVRIFGGPRIDLLQSGTPEIIETEVERILRSGILRGGLFVLREGNNLAPGTPLENIDAMYHAGRRFGTPDRF